LSELLVHFTGRPRPRKDLPVDVSQLSAQERLERILKNQTVLAMETFYAPVPVVCFTESTPSGIEYMIGDAGFEPWGIVFHREHVFEEGGGPVFHLRGDEWDHRQALPLRVQSRVVKFAPGEAEWVEEREWRIPYDDGSPGFEFNLGDVEALIVGDLNWPPPDEEIEMVYTPWDDWEPELVPVRPRWLPHCAIWHWNPDNRALEGVEVVG
jgi:hypothetical protein